MTHVEPTVQAQQLSLSANRPDGHWQHPSEVLTQQPSLTACQQAEGTTMQNSSIPTCPNLHA